MKDCSISLGVSRSFTSTGMWRKKRDAFPIMAGILKLLVEILQRESAPSRSCWIRLNFEEIDHVHEGHLLVGATIENLVACIPSSSEMGLHGCCPMLPQAQPPNWMLSLKFSWLLCIYSLIGHNAFFWHNKVHFFVISPQHLGFFGNGSASWDKKVDKLSTTSGISKLFTLGRATESSALILLDGKTEKRRSDQVSKKIDLAFFVPTAG